MEKGVYNRTQYNFPNKALLWDFNGPISLSKENHFQGYRYRINKQKISTFVLI